jgi:hypothetical protein
MVCKAGDDGVVPIDRHEAFHDADGDGVAFERATLLDVELEIRVVRALRPARIQNPLGVAANLSNRVGPRPATSPSEYATRLTPSANAPPAGRPNVLSISMRSRKAAASTRGRGG